jgi:cytosine deaminase
LPQTADTIFRQARLPSGSQANIVVTGGRITAIEADPARLGAAKATVDLAGALVLPGFVEGHIHLDKCWIGDVWKPYKPYSAGFNVRERLGFEAELLADAAPMDKRASALIELAISNGSTNIRSHVDVDATVGLRHLETLVAVRERYRDMVTIELVAFPQHGILACPGTAELLDRAIAAGADRIGGIDPASMDRDVEGQLDIVFAIAERRDVDVDIHLHDPGLLGIFQLEQIAARTSALGMQGKVAVSHAYCLGDVALDMARRTAAALAEAGVAIMTNAPGSRPFPPIKELRAAGVVVFSGNDNVRDSWWPYGEADMLQRAMLLGYCSGFFTDEDLSLAFELVTSNGARALGLADYGLAPGARADFVVVDAEHVQEAVVARPVRKAVYKSGRLVAHNGVYCGG